MKILVSILLTAMLSFIAGLYFPWWSFAVVAFFIALLIKQTIIKSFFSGFLGIFIFWTLLSYWIDIKNNSILSQKIAQLFSLGYPLALIIVTAFIGGIVGGLASMSGGSLMAIIKNKA